MDHGPPPGWYADPYAGHQLRFYDGARWSEHVADEGRTSLDTVPVAGLARARPPELHGRPPEAEVPARILSRDEPATDEPFAHEVLVIDPGATDHPSRSGPAARTVRSGTGRMLGSLEVERPGWFARGLAALAVDARAVAHRLRVRGVDGADRLVVRRHQRSAKPALGLHLVNAQLVNGHLVNGPGPDWRLEPERLVGPRRWALIASDGDGEAVAHLECTATEGATVVHGADGGLLGGSAGTFDVVGDAPAPDGRLLVACEPLCPPELAGIVLAALLAVVVLEGPAPSPDPGAAAAPTA